MYCCDLCGKKSIDADFLSTRHIVPLQQGGKDDIYNVACLCDECHDRVERNNVDMAKTEQILSALKRRVFDPYPQYRNIMTAWFNMTEESYSRARLM